MSVASSTTGALLLAAGFSRRFNGIKLHAQLPDGSTLLQQSLINILQATDNIIIVGREELLKKGVYSSVEQSHTLKLVLCPDAESGMGHSLACGIRHIPEHWQSVMICFGDMPFIRPRTLLHVMRASSEDNIVVPCFKSQRGHPVSFGKQYFAELAASAGDTGGRHVLQKHQQRIVELPVDDAGILQDIDTPEALAALYRGQPGDSDKR